MDPKELAAKAKQEAAALFVTLRGVTGGLTPAGLQGLIAVAPAVVKHVEAIAGPLKGADKMALAVEITIQSVKLPWWLPESLVRRALPALLEMALSALKDALAKPKP